jgi:hypothetical protein
LCLIQARSCLLAIERRVGHAVKLLALHLVDDKNNLIIESPSIQERWSSHPVALLPFFATESFLDIRARVQKAQKLEALMIDDEPPAQQKHWISREIGDKVVPKLNASIRTSQTLMQVQWQHTECFSAMDKRMLLVESKLLSLESKFASVESKLDTIMHHLLPSSMNMNLDSDNSVSDNLHHPPEHPVTPTPSKFPAIMNLAFSSPSSELFKLSYDQAKNSKGQIRKKAPPQQVLNHPFSSSNITASDYWNEYYYGSAGKLPLKVLEENHGSTWRSDSNHKRLDGKKGTALKASWSLQKPIYEYIEHLMVSNTEEVALGMVQEVFSMFPYKHYKKPILIKCKREFIRRWGLLP